MEIVDARLQMQKDVLLFMTAVFPCKSCRAKHHKFPLSKALVHITNPITAEESSLLNYYNLSYHFKMK